MHQRALMGVLAKRLSPKSHCNVSFIVGSVQVRFIRQMLHLARGRVDGTCVYFAKRWAQYCILSTYHSLAFISMLAVFDISCQVVAARLYVQAFHQKFSVVTTVPPSSHLSSLLCSAPLSFHFFPQFGHDRRRQSTFDLFTLSEAEFTQSRYFVVHICQPLSRGHRLDLRESTFSKYFSCGRLEWLRLEHSL